MKNRVVLLSTLAAGLMLVGCVETTTSSVTPTTSSSASSSVQSSVSSTSVGPAKTVITIADWNLGAADADNLLRRRVAAFNAASTTIEIQPVVFPGGDYNAWLTSLAAANQLPDIMMANSVAEYTQFGWTADIKALVDADPEWNLIPEGLRNTMDYGTKVLGIPVGFYLLGYFVNHDLVNDLGTELGGLTSEELFTAGNFTYEDFAAAVEDVNDLTKTDGSGVIGLDNVGEMLNWLPAALDTTGQIQHYMWNSTTEKLDFLNDAVKASFVETKRLFEGNYVYEGALTSVEAKAALGMDGWAGDLFFKGQLGFKWGGTWDTWFDGAIKDAFNYEFIGVPGDKVVGVGDYYVISADAEVEEAYEVAKYLTFGTAGVAKALDIVYSNPGKGFSLPGLPLNSLFADIWVSTSPLPGVATMVDMINAGELTVLFEGNKWIPGYPAARWNYKTSIDAQLSRPDAAAGTTLSIGDLIWDASQGKISYTDYVTTELANLLNGLITTATDEVLG